MTDARKELKNVVPTTHNSLGEAPDQGDSGRRTRTAESAGVSPYPPSPKTLFRELRNTVVQEGDDQR